jgi:hypothetical protein
MQVALLERAHTAATFNTELARDGSGGLRLLVLSNTLSVVDIIAALPSSAIPAQYWRDMKRRFQDEGSIELQEHGQKAPAFKRGMNGLPLTNNQTRN